MPYIMQEFRIPKAQKAYAFLMQNLSLNIAEAQRLINKGRVFYNGTPLGNHQKAKILENSVSVLLFKPESTGIKPLFENDDFAIFNKPPKMLIHPKGRFTHHSLIDEVRFLYGNKANLAHRIDSETSGLVLVGKHKKSTAELGEMFVKNNIKKTYLALVQGDFTPLPFCLSLPLATQEKGGDLCVRSIIKGEKDGILNFKSAKTAFDNLGQIVHNSKHFSLLKIEPYTGRTHQIRAHLNALNFPILGDPLYGTKDSYSREYLDSTFICENLAKNQMSDEKRLEYFGATRLMLHSYALRFEYKEESFYFYSAENFEIKGNML